MALDSLASVRTLTPVTKKKSSKKQPGPKLSKHDKIRVYLAVELRESYGFTSYTAIRRACVFYPHELGTPLTGLLKKVPINDARRVGKYLKQDSNLEIVNIHGNGFQLQITNS